MFKDDIFDKWLDEKSQEIAKKISNNKSLSNKEIMIAILKVQTNNFKRINTK